jgi:hypothetical protein
VNGIANALQNEIQWPTPQQFYEYREKFLGFHFLSTFNNALCIVDGTKVRIFRPSKSKQSKVVGKKNCMHLMFYSLYC